MTTRTRLGLVAVAFVGGMFTAAGLTVVLVAVSGKQANSEPASVSARQADSWDTRQLADYLKANGFPKLEVVNGDRDRYFVLNTEKHDYSHHAVVLDAIIHRPDTVAVRDMESEANATRFMHNRDDRSLPYYWQWGRFVFHGESRDFAKLKKVLH